MLTNPVHFVAMEASRHGVDQGRFDDRVSAQAPTPLTKLVTLCLLRLWEQVAANIDALPSPSVEASSGELLMGSENNGMIRTGTNFNLRPKLYFDLALPDNVQQQVGEEATLPSPPIYVVDADAVMRTCPRCSVSTALSWWWYMAGIPCVDASPPIVFFSSPGGRGIIP